MVELSWEENKNNWVAANGEALNRDLYSGTDWSAINGRYVRLPGWMKSTTNWYNRMFLVTRVAWNTGLIRPKTYTDLVRLAWKFRKHKNYSGTVPGFLGRLSSYWSGLPWKLAKKNPVSASDRGLCHRPRGGSHKRSSGSRFELRRTRSGKEYKRYLHRVFRTCDNCGGPL